MAAASYDQLLKQVEALKMENSNLRQELEDNSNHLTKLETEASTMKVLQAPCLCVGFLSLPFVSWTGNHSEFCVLLDSYASPFPGCVKEKLSKLHFFIIIFKFKNCFLETAPSML